MVVQSFGSRGDIQPYIAIASGLQNRGYEIMVFTNEDHVPLVSSFGVKTEGANVKAAEFMETNEPCKKSMAEGDVQAFLACLSDKQLTQEFGEVWAAKYAKQISEFKPEMVVSGTLSDWYAQYCIHVLNIPTVKVMLQLIMASKNRTPWGLPHLPCGLNYMLIDKVFGDLYKADSLMDKARLAKLPQTPVYGVFQDKGSFVTEFFKDPKNLCIGQSPQVADVLYDKVERPKGVTFTGSFIIEEEQQLSVIKKGEGGNERRPSLRGFGTSSLISDMEKFIQSGSKTVYMGWGSMTCKSPEHMAKLAVRALQIAGCQGIILGGFAKISMEVLKSSGADAELIEYAEKNVMFVLSAPHEWLFKRCDCLVHHGGAGTLNAGLRSGAPQVITPVFLDQFDHAYLVEKLGIGAGTKQFQKIDAEELGNTLKKVLDSPDCKTKAKEVAEKEKATCGVENVIAKVETFVKEQVVTGKWMANYDIAQKAFKANKEWQQKKSFLLKVVFVVVLGFGLYRKFK